MSINHHFHLRPIKEGFSDELINDLKNEVEKNSQYVSGYIINKDVILINIKGPEIFETIFLMSTKLDKYPTVEFPDGTLYSGFKYSRGRKNVFACKLMLLMKCHLKENLALTSEGLEYGIECDWEDAIRYIQSEYGYKIDIYFDKKYRLPQFKINEEHVKNEFDEDGKMFDSMFTWVSN